MAPKKKCKVFVSYSRHDEALVRPLAGLLGVAADDAVFLDVTSLKTGDLWETEIFDALKEAKVFVLCWCCESEKSKNVAKEIAAALSDRSKKLVPVLFCEAPLPEELAKRQWTDLRKTIKHVCPIPHERSGRDAEGQAVRQTENLTVQSKKTYETGLLETVITAGRNSARSPNEPLQSGKPVADTDIDRSVHRAKVLRIILGVITAVSSVFGAIVFFSFAWQGLLKFPWTILALVVVGLIAYFSFRMFVSVMADTSGMLDDVPKRYDGVQQQQQQQQQQPQEMRQQQQGYGPWQPTLIIVAKETDGTIVQRSPAPLPDDHDPEADMFERQIRAYFEGLAAK